jgi:glycogen debranching enzyme
VIENKPDGNQPPPGFGYFARVMDTIHVKLLGFDPDLLKDDNQDSIILKANKTLLKISQDLWGTLFSEFQVNHPGPIDLKLKTCVLSTKSKEKLRILVQPSFSFNSTRIEVSDIRMQTNLSRCLGPLEDWPKVLSRQISIGFNFFHITSVQHLGKLGSLYCIGDYSELNDCFFTQNDLTPAEKSQKLKDQVFKIQEMGAGIVVDLVLSHCSSTNPIFSLSSDAAYTLNNSPHLKVAFELDYALKKLSKDMEESRTKFKFANRIENEEHLQYTMEVLRKRVQDLRLFEFFCVDTEKMLQGLVDQEVRNFDLKDLELIENFKEIGIKGFLIKKGLKGLGVGRFQAEIDFPALWKNALFSGISRDVVIREASKEIMELNNYLTLKFSRKSLKIFLNIEAEIRYHKLELRVFEVTKEKPLVRAYFTELPSGEAVLLNGFIYSPKRFYPDISLKWNYLYRSVITWNDCVKLNYGKSQSSCSSWFPIIENHVISMAQTFSGFRLDNCHGTPLWVSRHLVEIARKVNPNLLVFAELFTDSPQMDSLYASFIGLNLILRESLACGSVSSLKKNLMEDFGDDFYGVEKWKSFEGLEDEDWVRFSRIPFVFYDFTHDNPTVSQLRGSFDVSSNLVAVAGAMASVASTKGYDEIIPLQLSVVDERRSYLKYSEEFFRVPGHKLMGVENGIQVFVELIDQQSKFSSVDIFGDWDGWKVPLKLEPSTHPSPSNQKLWICELEFPISQKGMKYGFKFCSNKHEWFCDTSQKHYTTWDGYTNNILLVEKNLPSLPYSSPNLHHLRHRMNLLREIWKDFGYSKSEIIELSDNILTIKKENPENHSQFWVFTRMGFCQAGPVRLSFHLPSFIDKIELFCRIQITGKYQKNQEFVNGVPFILKGLNFSDFGKVHRGDLGDFLEVQEFLVGDVLVVKTRPVFEEEILKIYKLLDGFHEFLFDQLSFHDFYLIFWGSRREESGIYEFPGGKQIKFRGIKGVLLRLKNNEKSVDHPVVRNLSEGNWYIDYFLKRLESLKSKVLYFYLNDIFIIIKSLHRDLVATLVIKVLKKLEKSSRNYLSEHMLKCSFIPDSLKMWFLQVWTEDPKFLCDPSNSSSLRFEHFWSSELLLLLDLADHSKELLISLAFQLKQNPKPSTSIHFLYQLSLYIEKDSSHKEILKKNLETETIQDFCLFLLTSMLNSSFDVESGLVLTEAGESWCKSPSRTGALIELSSMLYKSLLFFSDFPDFSNHFSYSNKGKSGEIFLKDWAELIRGSFRDLYFIPNDGSSRFVRPELVRETGIFKDTLGCYDEELEYRCSINQLLAFNVAPSLFDSQVVLKMWKKCSEVLGSQLFVKDFDGSDAKIRSISRFWMIIAGIRLGVVGKMQAFGIVEEFVEVIEDQEGLGEVKGGEFSGLAYLGLFSLLKALN